MRASPAASIRIWLRSSLRARLWLWLGGLVLLTGLVTAALSYIFGLQEANELQDAQLRQIAALVDAGELRTRTPRATAEGDNDTDARFVVQHVGDRGAGTVPVPTSYRPGMHTLKLHGGNEWRVFVRDTSDGRIAVAQRMDLRDDAAGDSALRTLLPILGMLPALVLLVEVVVRRALSPVRRLAIQVDAREDNDLQPLATREVPRELAPFVAAINRLLERIAALVDRERRFVADAAHELRTPIAALSLQAENLGRAADLPPQARERLDSLQQGLRRTRTVVEQLLSLARAQAPVRLQREALDPARVVRHVVEDLMPLARSRGIDLGVDRADAATLLADAALLTVLLRNAVDNALRYTPRGGRVDLRVVAEGGDTVIEVADNGPGIPAEQMERAFEPFERLDAAGSGEGSGLGLAIMRSVADRLGGELRLLPNPGGGLLVRYRQAGGGDSASNRE